MARPRTSVGHLVAAAVTVFLAAPAAHALDRCALTIRTGVSGIGGTGIAGLNPLCLRTSPRSQPSNVSSPAVEGPVTGGSGSPFVATTGFDLARVGYRQDEFFISGTASAFTNAGAFRSDGRWRVAPAGSAEYKTRILVYRPIDPRDFGGTVVVEWLNVSGGLDAGPDWTTAHVEMIRRGMAWVGVSAQLVGVEGGISTIPGVPSGLKGADPARYASLHHPGDSFSYDMFSQAGQAVRRPNGIDPLGGLEPDQVIAIGESQSAFRLVTYVNAIDPRARVYDGFLIHSRGGGGAALSQAPEPVVNTPGVARIRTDVRVPVLTFQTETDLTILGYLPDRQPDSSRFRLWEVAGTAHADTYTLTVGQNDLGDSTEAAEILVTSDPVPGFISCDSPINSGPQHFVLKAAVAALDRWVRGGAAPPRAPRLATTGAAIARDEHGNALGGIRTSYVDVPTVALSGEGQSGASFCRIFGTTVPFDAAKLAALYPSHQAYVAAVERSTDRAVRAGFVLAADAPLIVGAAAESDVGQ
jgi:Alpha/beta hydrolase domain